MPLLMLAGSSDPFSQAPSSKASGAGLRFSRRLRSRRATKAKPANATAAEW